MESMIVGIGGVLFILALFGGLSQLEAGRRRRMLQDVTRSPSSTSTRTFQLSGDLLPREETSLGPVDYRRIPPADPVGYVQTTQTARHAPTVETSFIVPALTAMGTALASDSGVCGAGVGVRLEWQGCGRDVCACPSRVGGSGVWALLTRCCGLSNPGPAKT